MRRIAMAVCLWGALGTSVGIAAEAGPELRPEWTVLQPEALPKSALKRVKKGVKLLQKERYSEFLVAFVSEEDMPAIDLASPAFAERFAGDKAAMVLVALSVVPDSEAWRVRDSEGREAWAVKVKGQVPDAPRDLILQELDGVWKIRD
jgi:hypothetical protein